MNKDGANQSVMFDYFLVGGGRVESKVKMTLLAKYR